MKHFIKSVLSESDGTGSWSRVSCAIQLVAVIVWVSYLVVKTHVLPDLGSATIFCTAAYLGNKASGMLKKD